MNWLVNIFNAFGWIWQNVIFGFIKIIPNIFTVLFSISAFIALIFVAAVIIKAILSRKEKGGADMSKKLYKIEDGKIICGVCGGIAEYLNLDYNVIRILTVLISVFCAFFPMLIAYIVMACILPVKSQTF